MRGSSTLAAMRFEGRTALVTGGGSGIGAATSLRLAAEGARVAVCDLKPESAHQVAADAGGSSYEMDVTSTESISAAAAAIESDIGPVDILVNNAGLGVDFFPLKSNEALWDQLLAVNLRGTLAVTQAILGGMHQSGGVIVNEALGELGERMKRAMIDSTALERIGRPEEVAAASA